MPTGSGAGGWTLSPDFVNFIFKVLLMDGVKGSGNASASVSFAFSGSSDVVTGAGGMEDSVYPPSDGRTSGSWDCDDCDCD